MQYSVSFLNTTLTGSISSKFRGRFMQDRYHDTHPPLPFSWEDHNEPNSGIGCASPSSCDSANFLSFLQQLRSAPAGKKLSITAAVYPTPFVGPNGAPLTDVSAYANVLDYVGPCQFVVFSHLRNNSFGLC
jgi:hypothetical protein